MKRTFIMMIIVSSCLGTALSQSTEHEDTASAKSFSGVLCCDSREFIDCIALRFQEATHPDGSSLVTTGIVAGATASLFLADKPVRSVAERSRTSFNNDFFGAVEQYGGTGNAILFSGSVYGAGLVFGAPEIRTTGRMMLESLLWTGAVTTVIKYIFSRSRPYTNEGNTSFHGIQFNDDYLSLPSGHSAVAFTLSSVLAGRIHSTAASIGLYSLAGMTGLARIYHEEHWFSDVFLGAAIGISVGTAVVRDEKEESSSSTTHTHVYLLPNGFGFVMEF